MSRAYYTYISGDRQAVPMALVLLREDFTIINQSANRWQRVFLDTFDWRMHNEGGVLEQTPAVDGIALTWRKLGTRELLGQITVPSPPHFVWNLPSGRFRRALEPILEMRALLPVAHIRAKTRELHLLNADGKTVARLIAEHRADRKGADILLWPMRGYDHELQRVQDALRQSGLDPDATEPLTEARFESGRRPCDSNNPLRVMLQPQERADVAARRILQQLFDALRANEPGLRADIDSEFLHDFRVAVRRTRSALAQIKGSFPSRTTDRFRREFAWLGQTTGPTRDLDVYLLQFNCYRDSLPPAMRSDLEPLRSFLQRHQREEHQRLVKALDGARYRRLLQSWNRFLDAPPPKRPSAPAAALPIVQVASHRILHMHRRALKEGTAITSESHNEDLHELRKTCKKLRYLIESFRSLFPEQSVDDLVKALKYLQDNLGELQDLEVQSASMTRFEDLMGREQPLSAGTRAAMEWLVNDMERRKRDVRRQFGRQFRAFARSGVTRRFHKVFKTKTNSP